MKESTSPFVALIMLASDCCSLGEFSSARTPASMSANVGSVDAWSQQVDQCPGKDA